MLPLVLDLLDRRVVVFGGGEVGLRKARYFADEAEVVVVSLDFAEGFDDLGVRKVRSGIQDSMDRWIEFADLVIAATDDPVLNERICDLARKEGKLFNQANGVGNFLIPSVVERGDLLIAISTLGRSPGLSKFLRLRLDGMLGEEWASMVRLQEEMRAELRTRVRDREGRKRILWSIMEDEGIWELLRSDYGGARERAMEYIGGEEDDR